MDLFNDVNDYPLRTFNRLQVAINIREDAGVAPAEEYINQFSKPDRQAMADMLAFMQKNGRKRTREIVTTGVSFPEYATDV
jgi:hypothetical protein